jgi:hypothetical protein
MSVRLTLAEVDTHGVLDTSPVPPLAPPAPVPGSPVRLAIVEPDPGVPTPAPRGSGAPPAPPSRGSRRALRQARTDRRRLAVVCVVVVAACLAATVLILVIAKDRSTRPLSTAGLVLAMAPDAATSLPHVPSS